MTTITAKNTTKKVAEEPKEEVVLPGLEEVVTVKKQTKAEQTKEELEAKKKEAAGTTAKRFTCPACKQFIQVRVNNYDESAVCPQCKADITLQ